MSNGDSLEPSSSIEGNETPSFHNEGEVLGTTTKYEIDTTAVARSPNAGPDDDFQWLWQTTLRIEPDGKKVGFDSEEYSSTPDVYTVKGREYGLLDKSDDPNGEKAKQIHERILELVEAKTAPEIIDEEVEKLRKELDPNGD